MFRVPHLSAHPGHPFLVTAAARKVQASQAIPRQENPRKRPREPPMELRRSITVSGSNLVNCNQ